VLSRNILELAKDSLYALSNPIELDGRPVSTHPPSARGFAPVNCYLVLDGNEALLVDTGLKIHERQVLEQLDQLLVPESRLTVLILRPSEYSSVSNARAIAGKFELGRVMLGGGVRPEDFHHWLDFHPPEVAGQAETGSRKLIEADRWSPMGQDEIPAPGSRRLQIIRPEIQLISTYWLYDATTRTLFTSDALSHVWRETADGPWAVECPDDAPAVDEICEYLTGARYWWMAGARTDPLRRYLKSLQETYEIECVAPASGCVLAGRNVVDRHFALMDEALEELSHRDPIVPELVTT
jgi:hypothetical protein